MNTTSTATAAPDHNAIAAVDVAMTTTTTALAAGADADAATLLLMQRLTLLPTLPDPRDVWPRDHALLDSVLAGRMYRAVVGASPDRVAVAITGATAPVAHRHPADGVEYVVHTNFSVPWQTYRARRAAKCERPWRSHLGRPLYPSHACGAAGTAAASCDQPTRVCSRGSVLTGDFSRHRAEGCVPLSLPHRGAAMVMSGAPGVAARVIHPDPAPRTLTPASVADRGEFAAVSDRALQAREVALRWLTERMLWA